MSLSCIDLLRSLNLNKRIALVQRRLLPGQRAHECIGGLKIGNSDIYSQDPSGGKRREKKSKHFLTAGVMVARNRNPKGKLLKIRPVSPTKI